MSALATAAIVFACTFGGGLVGLMLRLPESHLGDETKHVVNATTGLVATMAALVLGLLVASAKSSYDAHQDGLNEIAANVALLGRVLDQYGPPAQGVREALRRTVAGAIERLWPRDASHAPTLAGAKTTAGGKDVYARILELSPANDAERALQSQAAQIALGLARSRLLLVARDESVAISGVFLVVLTFWLVVLFASFGVFAPRNSTTVAALLISVLSVSGAILLIVELAQPFGGLMEISSTPLRDALAQLGGS